MIIATSPENVGKPALFEIIYKRLLAAIPLLLILSIVAFSIIKSLPGDPIDVMLGAAQRDIPPEQLASLRTEFGLDRPVPEQYVRWLYGVVAKGNLGLSYKDGRPVADVIKERIPATLVLVFTSLVIAFILGIVWGLAMVWFRSRDAKSYIESSLFSLAMITYSAPNFWLALLAITFLANCPQFSGISLLGLHDPGEEITFWSMVRHAIIPAIILASRRTAKIALFVRASTLDEMSKEYVVTARSKGLSRSSVLLRHVARNSLLPVASLAGLSLPALLGGSVLIETVFAWPGMGRLSVESTFARNYPVILALIMLYGVMVIISSLLADIVQIVLDPRISQSQSEEQASSGVRAV